MWAQDAWRFAPDWKAIVGLRAERWTAHDGQLANATQLLTYGDRRQGDLSPKAAVGYYGSAIAKNASEAPRIPTQLHFGERDHGIPLSDVKLIQEQRPEVEVRLYPAEHGFNCDARASYSKESAQLALSRTLSFFELHLERIS